MAEDAFSILTHLGIQEFSVLGLSMGGAIAQEMAILYPDRIKNLIIVGGWAKPDKYLTSLFELFRDVKRSVDPLTFDREIALWSFSRSYFDTSYEELEKRQRAALDVPYPTPHTTFTRQCEACMAHDSFDRLGEIQASTLLVVGKEDIFTPPHFSNEMAEKIPNARVVEIEGAAHAAYWEKVDEINDLVLAHVAPQVPA
jgi:pimeloyl-ACP methyl ester carboxylesterase